MSFVFEDVHMMRVRNRIAVPKCKLKQPYPTSGVVRGGCIFASPHVMMCNAAVVRAGSSRAARQRDAHHAGRSVCSERVSPLCLLLCLAWPMPWLLSSLSCLLLFMLQMHLRMLLMQQRTGLCTDIYHSTDCTGTRARLGAPASPSTRCWGRHMS